MTGLHSDLRPAGELLLHGLEHLERLGGLNLALGVAVAGELGLDGRNGEVHALAAFGLDGAGLEGGEGGGEGSREEGGRGEGEEGEKGGEVHDGVGGWIWVRRIEFGGFGGVLV